jgi:recombinational DNA repair protein RecR
MAAPLTSFRLSKQELKLLRRRARRLKLTISAIIRQALGDVLHEEAHTCPSCQHALGSSPTCAICSNARREAQGMDVIDG